MYSVFARVALLLFVTASITDSHGMLPEPSGQDLFRYSQRPAPLIKSDPAEAKPIGVGSLAEGGDTLTIQVGLDQTGLVDIYFVVAAPSLLSEIFVLTPKGLQPMSVSGFVPWREDFAGRLNETLFGNIPMSDLPSAIYSLFLVVTSANTLDSFYVWSTEVGGATSSIGTTGGTAADPGGASAQFPAGALQTESVVRIFTHRNSATLPAPAGGRDFPMLGGARFGPDGLSFDKPVTITIPLSDPLKPRAKVPLFVYDRDRGGWRMTEFMATVSPDGRSVHADVTHFSDYIIMARDAENADLYFGEFEKLFFDICDPIPTDSLFEAYIRGFSAAFPLGDRDLHDFTVSGLKRNFGCYEIVGHDYVLSVSRSVPDPNSSERKWLSIEDRTLEREVGDKGSIALVFLYDGVKEISDLRCGEYQLAFDWAVTAHLRCTRPDLVLDAPAMVYVGRSAPVSAQLMCAGHGMAGQALTFEIEGLGSLSQTRATTAADGSADVRLTGKSAPSCSGGQARLTAGYRACSGRPDEALTEAFASLGVRFSLSGRWSVRTVADETDCGEGINVYNRSVNIRQSGNTVTASAPGYSASGTKQGCRITGWSSLFEDDGITASSGSLNISSNANSMSGVATWLWVSGDDSCSGDSTFSLKR